MRKAVLSLALAGAALLGATAPAFADAGDWLVRGRVIGVLPDVDSSLTPALTASVDDSWMPELDFTYFFSDNIAAELILATTEHDVSASGVNLGSVWVLPPTLTLQYHFMPHGQVRPYVGAGVNYTMFYGEDEPAGINMEYDNSFGAALQAGADFPINENWVFNVDVKKIWITTDVNVNGGAVTGDVDINPWVVGVGFGFRF